MDIKFVAATQTPELVKQVLGSANKFTNEYDLWITFTVCVTAIIIIGLICLTIYLLRNRKEEKRISTVLTALLEKDKDIINQIKSIVETYNNS